MQAAPGASDSSDSRIRFEAFTSESYWKCGLASWRPSFECPDAWKCRRRCEPQDERAGVRHFRQDHISLKIHFEARITPPFLKLFLFSRSFRVLSTDLIPGKYLRQRLTTGCAAWWSCHDEPLSFFRAASSSNGSMVTISVTPTLLDVEGKWSRVATRR